MCASPPGVRFPVPDHAGHASSEAPPHSFRSRSLVSITSEAGGSMRKLIVAAFVALTLVGCSSTPTNEGSAPVEDRSGTAATPGGGASTSGTGTGGVSGQAGGTNTARGNPLRDPSSPLSKRSVYFDFDSFNVKDEYKPT